MSLYKERKKRLKEKRFQEGKIVERCRPAAAEPALPAPNNIGICRIVFSVDDIDRMYADLKAKKVQFVAPLRSRIYSCDVGFCDVSIHGRLAVVPMRSRSEGEAGPFTACRNSHRRMQPSDSSRQGARRNS